MDLLTSAEITFRYQATFNQLRRAPERLIGPL